MSRTGQVRRRKLRLRPADAFTAVVGLVILGALVVAWDWPLRASIIVLVLGSIGVAMVVAQLVLDVSGRAAETEDLPYEIPSLERADPGIVTHGVAEVWGWLVGLLAATFLIGLPLALVAFVFLYTKLYGGSWSVSIGMAAAIAAFEYGVYDRMLRVYWPEALIWQLFE